MNVEPRIARAVIGAVRERDRSGYEIWRWLGPVHGASTELTEANLYPVLYSLEAQGILESHWREDEATRRVYRLARSGFDLAIANGWAPIAHRPVAADAGGSRDSTPAGRNTNASDSSVLAERMREAPPRDARTGAQIAGYLDDFCSSLRLDDIHRSDVRAEIEDHLTDTAALLRSGGVEADDAAATAIGAFGPGDTLAKAIEEAQWSPSRLKAGLSWGSGVATLSLVVAFALIVVAVVLAGPLFGLIVRDVAAMAGSELYFPRSGPIEEAEALLPAGVAAFLAARRSLTQAALRSRRSEEALRTGWILFGAAPLGAIGLLVPVARDPVSFAGAFGLPAMWTFGCLRPVRVTGDLITRPGAAITTVAIAAGLVFPGAHSWIVQPAQLPAAASPLIDGPLLEPEWTPAGSPGAWSIHLDVDTRRWQDVRIELWPMTRDGLSLHPSAAAAPAYEMSLGQILEFDLVPSTTEDWQVILTAADSDGSRRTIWTEIRPGVSPPRAPLIGWLLSP